MAMCLSQIITHHHTSAAVGVPLPPLPVRMDTLSGAALDDAEHSLTDLDFCDQLARRLFSHIRDLDNPRRCVSPPSDATAAPVCVSCGSGRVRCAVT